MSSPPAQEQAQFVSPAGFSNLDRCTRCGEPRAVHGLDWACPTSSRSPAPVIVLLLGVALAVLGAVVWALTSAQAAGTFGATSLFLGITSAVAAVITLQRRR